jgi:hypothetical protein
MITEPDLQCLSYKFDVHISKANMQSSVWVEVLTLAASTNNVSEVDHPNCNADSRGPWRLW